MTDARLTKAQLQAELAALRQRVAELERRPGAIESAEAHYRTLVDSLDISVCRWLPDTTLTFANDNYRHIFGIQGEAIGQRWLDFLPVETRAETAAFYAEVAINPRPLTYEHPVTVDDGQVRQYQWRDTPIYDGQGQVVEFQSVGLDITDRKQAEAAMAESEVRFRGLLDATPDAMVIINGAGQILMVNAQTERMFGYAHSELVGSTVENLLPGHLHTQHLASRARFMAEPRMVTTGIDRDIYAKRKNGVEFPVEISLSYHQPANGEAVVLCAIRDVTERQRARQVIAAQRDLARLTNSNLPLAELWPQCFEAMLQVSGLDSGGIYLFNETARAFELVYHAGVSEAFVNAVSRYSEDTPTAQIILTGHTIYATQAELSSRGHHLAEGLRSLALIPIRHHAQILGGITLASHTLDNVADQARTALEVLAQEIGNLIIHQHTEEALRTSRQQLSQTLLAARMGTWRYDLTTQRMSWSPEAASLFGAGLVQNDFSAVVQRFHPDDRAKLIQGIQATVAQQRVQAVEYRLIAATGEIMWVTHYGHVELDAAGQPLAISGLIQDITQRKRVEQALTASEEFLKESQRIANMGSWRFDLRTYKLHWSENCYALYGFEPYELEPTFELFKSALHPDDRHIVDEAFADLLQHPRTANQELRIFDKQGRMKWVFNNMTPVLEAGRVVQFNGIQIDITERKQVEQALSDSEEQYRLTLSNISDAVFITDDAGVFTFVCPNVDILLGYTRAEVEAMQHITRLLGRELVDRAELDRLGEIPNIEHVLVDKAGREHALLVTVKRIAIKQGRILYTCHDISERKQAEEALRLAEQRYRAMIENAPDGIVLIDVNGKFKYASPSVERIFGYTQADLPQCDSLTMTHADDQAVVLAELTKLLNAPTYVPSLQYRFRHKNGDWRWIESTFSNLLTAPNVEAIIINFRDIHERKLAEDDLKKSQDLLKEAQRIGRIGYMEWNGQARELICSDEIYAIFGLPPGSAISQEVIAALMSPAERNRLELLDLQAIQRRGDMNYEYAIQTAAGQPRCLHQIGKMTYGEDGQPVRTMMIIQDITERKQAESDLRASEEKYRGLIESLDSVVATVDADGFFRYMNDMGAERLGGTAADLIGRNMRNVFPEPLASRQLAGIQQIFQTDRAASFEAQSMGADHSPRWYRFSLQPLHGDNGQVVQVLINATDIHDLKTAQQELQELNRTLEERVKERAAQVQDLYDNAPTGYHSLDADGRFLTINRTELNWLGYTADQMLGHSFAEFVDEPGAEQFRSTFLALQREGRVTNLEFDMKRRDGTTFPVLINAVAIRDEQGRYLRSRSTMTDITERKRAETELKRNVNFTTALLEAIPTPVYYKDKAGRYQGCNRAFTDMMGLTSAEIQGKTVHELWASHNANLYHQRDLELMHSCVQQVYEATIIDKQGTSRPVIFVKNVFYDESSHVAGIVGAFVDITERKQAEEALHERERHSQSLLRLSRQLEQAQAYSDVLNAARAEVQTAIGYQNLWIYLLTADKQHARLLSAGGPVEEKLMSATTLTIRDDPMLEEIVQAKEIVVIEDARTDARTNKAIVAALGNRTIVNVPVALFDRNLGSVGVGTFGDEGVRIPTASDREYLIALASHMAVTFDRIHLLNERKRAEEDLQLANVELQRALRVKDEFLASMSHELRTPLNAVLGLSESLSEQFIGPLNERQLRAVQTIESSGRHLLDLINDILDLSKLEANQVALELASINVDDVCAASFMFIKDSAYKKYIQLSSTLDPAVKYLLADERRLKQMLVNLLSNAVKFTPEGGTVKLQVSGNAAARTVSFAVSDTGIGIAPENIARLFQPFVQLDGGLNRQYEGTGLGLSLVARMAKLHGGRVTVDSQPGRGSCFTIVLPWKHPGSFSPVVTAAPPEPVVEDFPEPASTAPLILVVEDNDSNVITLSTYLQATGYRVAIARNGHEALEQVRLKRPALILMDLQMPVMDGLEATRRLRSDKDLQVASTPVIALTALAMPNDRRRSLEAGANEYVSKPVNLKRLTEVINRLVGEK